MSTPERFQFTSTDGLSIACVKWRGHDAVRGVVQIAHGLGEHMGRYAELAEIQSLQRFHKSARVDFRQFGAAIRMLSTKQNKSEWLPLRK